MAASTTEPLLEPSDVENRTRIWFVGVNPATESKTKHTSYQPPDTPLPLGPTVSKGNHVAPLSSDTSTTNVSVFGAAPESLLNQRA